MHELTVAIQIRQGLEIELSTEDGVLVADAVRVQIGALSGIVIGGVLSYMQFDKTLPAGEQPESALWGIMICTAFVPAGMSALKLIMLRFFTLTEESLKATKRVT